MNVENSRQKAYLFRRQFGAMSAQARSCSRVSPRAEALPICGLLTNLQDHVCTLSYRERLRSNQLLVRQLSIIAQIRHACLTGWYYNSQNSRLNRTADGLVVPAFRAPFSTMEAGRKLTDHPAWLLYVLHPRCLQCL